MFDLITAKEIPVSKVGTRFTEGISNYIQTIEILMPLRLTCAADSTPELSFLYDISPTFRTSVCVARQGTSKSN